MSLLETSSEACYVFPNEGEGKCNMGNKAVSGRFVAYYRVSTKRQGDSGLGLEAQREAVRQHLARGGWPPLAELVEVESGRKVDRPKLIEALALCRLHNATLIIAKLDRLARNVAFTASLMDSGVEFVACDFPQANRLTIHILAAVAEHEREAISQRTKAALAAAKVRGVRLGNDGSNLRNGALGAKRGQAVRQANAAARSATVLPIVRAIQADGTASLRGIAAALNARTIPAPRGGSWSANQVRRALAAADNCQHG